MEIVEKKVQDGPVRIGIGPEEHHEALRYALDCERVLTLEQIDGLMGADYCPLRTDASDVAVILRPTYLSPAHIKWLAQTKCFFEVPGHDPVRLLTWDDRQGFRALKPDPERFKLEETRGAKKTYQIPDDYHDTAVALWHHGQMINGKWRPTYKPAEIVAKIKEDTGVEVSRAWARDRAFEKVGHYRRNPEG